MKRQIIVTGEDQYIDQILKLIEWIKHTAGKKLDVQELSPEQIEARVRGLINNTRTEAEYVSGRK